MAPPTNISTTIPPKTIKLAIILTSVFIVLLCSSLVLFCIIWTRASAHRAEDLRTVEAGGLSLNRCSDDNNAQNKNENGGIELIRLPVRPFPARVTDLKASPSPLSGRKKEQLLLPREGGPCRTLLPSVTEQQPVAVVKRVAARSSWYGHKGGQYERFG